MARGGLVAAFGERLLLGKIAENGQIDKRAIEAMGDVLAGTNKPFIVTSGTGLISPGKVTHIRSPMRITVVGACTAGRRKSLNSS